MIYVAETLYTPEEVVDLNNLDVDAVRIKYGNNH
jgi:hypothetical protein